MVEIQLYNERVLGYFKCAMRVWSRRGGVASTYNNGILPLWNKCMPPDFLVGDRLTPRDIGRPCSILSSGWHLKEYILLGLSSFCVSYEERDKEVCEAWRSWLYKASDACPCSYNLKRQHRLLLDCFKDMMLLTDTVYIDQVVSSSKIMFSDAKGRLLPLDLGMRGYPSLYKMQGELEGRVFRPARLESIELGCFREGSVPPP